MSDSKPFYRSKPRPTPWEPFAIGFQEGPAPRFTPGAGTLVIDRVE